MKEQIIRLEPDDDVVSVRDKLGWVRARRVLLVFPDDPRQPILQRKLDLVLIQREATRRRAQLALITRDPIVTEHAHELGIACFRTVEASRKRYWETQRARLIIQRRRRPRSIDVELVEAGTRLQAPSPSLSPEARKALAIAIFGVALAVLLLGVIAIVPGATVYLTPAANQVSVTTTITADPEASEVDLTRSLIPARLIGVTVEAAATVDTTGTTQQPSEKAQGMALFTNLIPDQVTIPAGTVIRTSASRPVRFVTLADATLPGQVGETVEVPIEALEPGFEGNLPGNRINQVEGPLASRVAVTNPEPTRGGDTVEVRSVSAEDHERLRAIVLQQLQQRAFAEMQTDPFIALQDAEFIPLESLSIVLIESETYLGFVGQVADEASLTMRATVQGVAIDERLARQVVYEQIVERIGPGYQIRAGSLVFRRGEVVEVDDRYRVQFIMQGAGDVSATIDPDEVRRLVRGRGIRQAITRLENAYALEAPPSIEVWPPFWPLAPLLPLRIEVEAGGS